MKPYIVRISMVYGETSHGLHEVFCFGTSKKDAVAQVVRFYGKFRAIFSYEVIDIKTINASVYGDIQVLSQDGR